MSLLIAVAIASVVTWVSAAPARAGDPGARAASAAQAVGVPAPPAVPGGAARPSCPVRRRWRRRRPRRRSRRVADASGATGHDASAGASATAGQARTERQRAGRTDDHRNHRDDAQDNRGVDARRRCELGPRPQPGERSCRRHSRIECPNSTSMRGRQCSPRTRCVSSSLWSTCRRCRRNGASADASRAARLHQSLNVILKNGQSLQVSRAVDPMSKRTTTVEVKATRLP